MNRMFEVTQPIDVLSVPENDVPDMIRGLMSNRELSVLVQGLHTKMRSSDPKTRAQACAALKHLGFTE